MQTCSLITENKFCGCPHIRGHHKAKNWGCPDTVDTNGLTPLPHIYTENCKLQFNGHLFVADS